MSPGWVTPQGVGSPDRGWRRGQPRKKLRGVWSIRGRARGSHSIADFGGVTSNASRKRGREGAPSEGRRPDSSKSSALTRRRQRWIWRSSRCGACSKARRARQRTSEAFSRPCPAPNTPGNEGAPPGRARDHELQQDRAELGNRETGAICGEAEAGGSSSNDAFARRKPGVTRSVGCSCRMSIADVG
jgi:hypothetical protein